MQKRLFQLPLCLLLISKESRLRTSHLPSLKQLLGWDGTLTPDPERPCAPWTVRFCSRIRGRPGPARRGWFMPRG